LIAVACAIGVLGVLFESPCLLTIASAIGVIMLLQMLVLVSVELSANLALADFCISDPLNETVTILQDGFGVNVTDSVQVQYSIHYTLHSYTILIHYTLHSYTILIHYTHTPSAVLSHLSGAQPSQRFRRPSESTAASNSPIGELAGAGGPPRLYTPPRCRCASCFQHRVCAVSIEPHDGSDRGQNQLQYFQHDPAGDLGGRWVQPLCSLYTVLAIHCTHYMRPSAASSVLCPSQTTITWRMSGTTSAGSLSALATWGWPIKHSRSPSPAMAITRSHMTTSGYVIV
jgi:hypothetical protein